MKVIIVKEVMTCDVSPVAMFFSSLTFVGVGEGRQRDVELAQQRVYQWLTPARNNCSKT